MPVPPKPPSKRRRRNVPKSYGAATPTIGLAAPPVDRTLGFAAHPMVERMWDALAGSAESAFYSEADWVRARLELLYANRLLTSDEPIRASAWAQVQHGLTAMLVSPTEKRRSGIELKPPTVDPDADAAVLMMSTYKAKLQADKPE